MHTVERDDRCGRDYGGRFHVTSVAPPPPPQLPRKSLINCRNQLSFLSPRAPTAVLARTGPLARAWQDGAAPLCDAPRSSLTLLLLYFCCFFPGCPVVVFSCIQMENVSNFLKACRAVGVAEHSLFETVDLYEGKDLGLVVRCLVREGGRR